MVQRACVPTLCTLGLLYLAALAFDVTFQVVWPHWQQASSAVYRGGAPSLRIAGKVGYARWVVHVAATASRR